MERVNYVDFIKGAAIIAVVFGHILCFEHIALFPVRPFFEGSWHVGVFFIVGGFFLKEVDASNIKDFLKKKTKQLYLLALFFHLPAVLLHNVLLRIGWYETANAIDGKVMTLWGVGDFVKQTILTICCAGREPIVGAMWFVYVLFFAMIEYSCMSLIISKVNRGGKNNQQYLLLTFFVMAVVSGILSNKYGITIRRCSNVFTAMLLIYIGKYMFQTMKLNFDNKLLAMAAAVMLYEVSVMYGGVALNGNVFSDIAALLAGCVSALYLIAYIGRRIDGSFVERFVRYCGKESFYIMALHFVGFKLCTMSLSLIGVNVCHLSDLQPKVGNNIFLIIAYLAFGTLFPLAFMWVFRRLQKSLRFL